MSKFDFHITHWVPKSEETPNSLNYLVLTAEGEDILEAYNKIEKDIPEGCWMFACHPTELVLDEEEA